MGLAFEVTPLAGLFIAPDALTTERSPLWMALLQNAVLMSYIGVPIVVGVTVFRYRLYDVDLLINCALVYGSLTVTLALTYLGSMVVLQHGFRAISCGTSQLAVVASTLAVAALFGPLRRRVQGLTDRRFYRGKYDAARSSMPSPSGYATRRTWTL